MQKAAEEGFVSATISYRLVRDGKHRWPAQVELARARNQLELRAQPALQQLHRGGRARRLVEVQDPFVRPAHVEHLPRQRERDMHRHVVISLRRRGERAV